MRYPEDLRRNLRVFLGLRFAGVYDVELIARAIGWTELKRSRVMILAREVDRDPFLRQVLRRGLPQHASTSLVGGVKYTCPTCQYKRESVPCPVCATRNWEPRPDLEEHEPEPTELPSCGTDAEPGSAEKLWILRERLALGQHLHHPDDKISSIRYDWSIPVIVSDSLGAEIFRDLKGNEFGDC